MTRILLLVAMLALVAGCTVAPPKPINANGSISPTVTVGDLDLVYQNGDALATTYVATCHAAPTTPGCNERLIARLKLEGRRLWHDPRKRQCSLASLTTLTYDGDRLVGIGLLEPAAHLLPAASKVAGA